MLPLRPPSSAARCHSQQGTQRSGVLLTRLHGEDGAAEDGGASTNRQILDTRPQRIQASRTSVHS